MLTLWLPALVGPLAAVAGMALAVLKHRRRPRRVPDYADIARLERELGLVEAPPLPSSSALLTSTVPQMNFVSLSDVYIQRSPYTAALLTSTVTCVTPPVMPPPWADELPRGHNQNGES